MHRLLIVSPHFPPVNAPDHQRVRMSLPYFEEFGWTPTVLTVQTEKGDTIDLQLDRTVPREISVHHIPIWPEKVCRRFGFGHLQYRCVFPLYRAGSTLLAREDFDLIYFSTTMFNVMPLGVLWKRRFGVPFVLDFQDPWYAGSDIPYDRQTAPGGMFKYRVSQVIASQLEKTTVPRADGLISVSEGYIKEVQKRYNLRVTSNSSVIPFGAPERDFELLKELSIKQQIFKPNDGLVHWVSVGRGGHDLEPALSALFEALAKLRSADVGRWSKVRLHFVGTSYAPVDRAKETVAPIARAAGVGDLVEEHVTRLPYFEALQVMVQSHGILMIGSTSGDYTASKLFPCVLAGKPIMACFHRNSLVSQIIPQITNCYLAAFNDPVNVVELEQNCRKGLQWLFPSGRPDGRGTHWDRLKDYSAKSLTRAQCDVFDRAMASPGHAATITRALP